MEFYMILFVFILLLVISSISNIIFKLTKKKDWIISILLSVVLSVVIRAVLNG